MPGGREKPLHLQSTTDLWLGILFPPLFGSLFVVVPLGGTPVNDSSWSTLWVALLFGGLFTLAGVLVCVPRLKEFRRRGAWAPPGTARQPVLVSIALVLLIMATGVAYAFAGIGVTELAMAAGLRGTAAGVLASVVFFSLVGITIFVLRRLARKLPGSEGNGATGPGPPAERPPE